MKVIMFMFTSLDLTYLFPYYSCCIHKILYYMTGLQSKTYGDGQIKFSYFLIIIDHSLYVYSFYQKELMVMALYARFRLQYSYVNLLAFLLFHVLSLHVLWVIFIPLILIMVKEEA